MSSDPSRPAFTHSGSSAVQCLHCCDPNALDTCQGKASDAIHEMSKEKCRAFFGITEEEDVGEDEWGRIDDKTKAGLAKAMCESTCKKDETTAPPVCKVRPAISR